jgi:hypothetical protein
MQKWHNNTINKMKNKLNVHATSQSVKISTVSHPHTILLTDV